LNLKVATVAVASGLAALGLATNAGAQANPQSRDWCNSDAKAGVSPDLITAAARH
jgi:hypothetical protein